MPRHLNAFWPLTLFIRSQRATSSRKRSTLPFLSAHPPPANRKQHFDQLQVRVYGDVGIVNGVVVTTDEKGPSQTGENHEVDRTVFTDVFVWRDGRWQAVNAQENAVRNTLKR